MPITVPLWIGSAALAFALSAAAQNKPDFSGTWKMDASRSESAHQAVPIGPVTLVVKQSAGEIVIETRRRDAKNSPLPVELLTYKLDGAEHIAAEGADVRVKTKAHWDGQKLVTETEREVQDSTVTTLYLLSLDPDSKELTIDKTLTVQHGYQFPGAKNTGKGTDVYVRQIK